VGLPKKRTLQGKPGDKDAADVGTACCGIEATSSGAALATRWKLTVLFQTPAITSWQDIPWPQVEANVHALQRRIYRAERQGPQEVLDVEFS
jgi:hypothetical protein